MAYTITETEYISIAGVPLATPAWIHTNLFEFWSGLSTRGQDRVIPGAAGVLPYPRRPTITPRTIELVIFGDVNWEGTPQTDTRAGLWANVDHLRTNVTDPLVVGDGTRELILYRPDGSAVSCSVQVEGFELGGGLGPDHTLATIDVTIVEGSSL